MGVLETNLRDSKSLFDAVWNRTKKGSVLRGLFGIEKAEDGQFKAASIIVPGKFRNFDGKAVINNLSAASKTYQTRLREHTLSIDFNTMKKADAIKAGGVRRALQGGAGMSLQDIEELATALLETGETATWMGDQLFFDDTHVIPGTNINLDNLLSGAWTDSAAEVKAACWAAKAAFDKMRNANNYLYHDSPAKIVLMYHPDIESFVQDAVNPERQAGGTTARVDNFIEARSNPYLADADDMYAFIESPEFPALMWGSFEDPNFVSNLDNMSDSDRIEYNRVLFQARHEGIEAFGSPFHVVKLKDA